MNLKKKEKKKKLALCYYSLERKTGETLLVPIVILINFDSSMIKVLDAGFVNFNE